jgi:hypothetical protein
MNIPILLDGIDTVALGHILFQLLNNDTIFHLLVEMKLFFIINLFTLGFEGLWNERVLI